MNILSLDIGTKRTGVAFTTTELQVPMALPTITEPGLIGWLEAVKTLVEQRSITTIVAGLPLLPDGSKGSQATFVEGCVTALQTALPAVICSFIDERYTSFNHRELDQDAAAAVQILQVYLDKNSV